MDRTKVSFAEAEGQYQYPAVLQWGEVDQRIRQQIWIAVSGHYKKTVIKAKVGESYRDFSKFWHSSYYHYRIETKFDYPESVYDDLDNLYSRIELIVKSCGYIEIFDFLQFCLRRVSKKEEKFTPLISGIQAALEKSYSPYRLLTDTMTVVPVLSQEQARTLQSDLGAVYSAPFKSAASHMTKAIEGMNKGDHAGTIREAITAVESAAVEYSGEPKVDLAAALKKLSKEAGSHPALLKAFGGLYGYTSDERGIRHSTLFGNQPNVKSEEALFFVSACAAFIGYLSQKATKAATSS